MFGDWQWRFGMREMEKDVVHSLCSFLFFWKSVFVVLRRNS